MWKSIQKSFQKYLGRSRNIHPNLLNNIPPIVNINSQNLHLTSSQNLPDIILEPLDLITSLSAPSKNS